MKRNFLDLRDKEIIKILQNKKRNIIFGAGEIGSMLVDIFSEMNIEIDSFLVNDNRKDKDDLKGVKIYELSELPYKKEECNIIYGVNSMDLEILNPLLKRFEDSILYLGGINGVFKLYKIAYEAYFKQRNIDISKEFININRVKFLNPFLLDDEYLNAFFFEAGDLILPDILEDYSKINEGPYEYDKVILKEGDVVLDCGANIGLFSAIAASKKCKVYAFEPVPDTLKYLSKTVEIYPEFITICKYALSDYNGDTQFFISSNSNISNSMFNLNGNLNEVLKVKTITVDEFVKRNSLQKVDFIKADIEGAERDMLKGAKETLYKFGPKLSICTYHLKDDPEVIEKIIKESNPNYVIEHKWKKLYAYIPENI